MAVAASVGSSWKSWPAHTPAADRALPDVLPFKASTNPTAVLSTGTPFFPETAHADSVSLSMFDNINSGVRVTKLRKRLAGIPNSLRMGPCRSSSTVSEAYMAGSWIKYAFSSPLTLNLTTPSVTPFGAAVASSINTRLRTALCVATFAIDVWIAASEFCDTVSSRSSIGAIVWRGSLITAASPFSDRSFPAYTLASSSELNTWGACIVLRVPSGLVVIMSIVHTFCSPTSFSGGRMLL